MNRDKNEGVNRITGNEERSLTNSTNATILSEMRDALTEHDYRTLFETMPYGILCQNSNGQIIQANPAAQQILGLTLAQLQNRTLLDKSWQMIHEDGSPFLANEQPAMVALRTGKPVNNVLMGVFNPREHAYRWINASAIPQIRPGENVPYLVHTIFYDYTDYKELQDSLRACEQSALARTDELEAVFQVIADHVSVYDSRGHVLQMSKEVRELFGLEQATDFTAHSLQEHSALLSLRDEDGHLLPEEQWPVQRILTGEVLRDATAVDITVRRLDGQDRQLSMSGAPMRDFNGQIIGAVTILQDVTERRTMERRTQRSLDALLAMAEAMVQEQQDKDPPLEDDLAVSGAPGITIPLLPAESVIGRRLVELPCRLLDCQRVGIALLDAQTEVLQPMVIVGISPEHEQHWRNSLQGARLGSLLGDSRLVARLHAGEVLSLDISHPLFRDQPSYKLITPILKGGELIGILLLGYGSTKPHPTPHELAIIHTIAKLASLLIERERAQHERDQALAALQAANDELEHTNRLKSDFLAIVSHEFRTALTGIQGFSELMRDEELSLMEMKEFAVDIHADARRLVRMITDMLDLERMEARRMQLNLSWLDLNAVIIDGVGRMRSLTAHHVIRLQLASALPILLGDHDKLSQVVLNLLQNAIKYSPAGGEVIVSSYIEGNMVHVYVRDYGVGIPVADLERIFERYARVALNSTRYIDGTGLGLPIAREIVQLHGGQIWAESVVGKGSIFHLTVRFTDPRL